MYAAGDRRAASVNVPIVPMRTVPASTKPRGGRDADYASRSLSSTSGPSRAGDHGGYERHCEPWGLDGIPVDFNSRLLEEDWPRFEELMENAIARVPSLGEMEVVKLINGPEAFTPDGEFILGPSDVRGFWVAAGFCAHGLAGAGGMGKLVAEWIVEGTPSLDVWHMDSRRFGRAYRSREYTLARTKEIYETYYDVKYPGHERSAGRPLHVSSAYERLQQLGAAFGEKSGWERANWFEPNSERGDESLRPRGWAGKLWSPAIGAEHLACRDAAAIFDESSFAKILVSGEGAADLLESLCANRVARDVGQVTYTQMLNPRGGIECDFTVTRLAEDRFRIVTGTAFGQHDLAWIAQHVPDDGSVEVVDETSAYACFGLWGPRARDILQPLASADLANETFPYMRARELAVGRVSCLALRVTYVGELGWELYCPSEFGIALWDTIWEAGQPHGLVAGGYKAIDSLRLEKGYRVWGADITPEDTPFEAGLGFAVKLDKGDFVGREALASLADPERLLRCLTLEDPRAIALGSEPVRVGDDPVGRVTSGGHGYTVEESIAYAYLPAEHDVGTEIAVEIFGEWVPGVVADEPLFDPAGRAHPRMSDLRGSGRARLAGSSGSRRGARRRHHEPQPEGRGRRGGLRASSGGKDTGLLGIDRTVELAATEAAAALGIGPEVVAFVEPEGWLVTRFVAGAIPPLERMREHVMLTRIARALRAFHDGAWRFPASSTRSASSRRIEEPHSQRGGRVPEVFDWAHELATRIETRRSADSAVPCHNDLLNANFLDDGERLCIVDWEYAGMGDRFFDLANFSINHELDADASRGFLEAYFGEARVETSQALELMRFMSDFREAMWGVVQSAVSELDFDFDAYASEHFERLRRTAESRPFI